MRPLPGTEHRNHRATSNNHPFPQVDDPGSGVKPVIEHPWSLSEMQAIRLQGELAGKVIREDRTGPVELIAGADVAYQKDGDELVAAVVVLEAESRKVVDTVTARDVVRFPYIPGLFSFRELPPLVRAFADLRHTPDLVVCDGQGIAHPRRFGLASHLGVIFDVPTIGCGKTRYVGTHAEPGPQRGATAPLFDGDEVVGNVLRTQTGIWPMYVSIGHRISLRAACDWILALAPDHRLPETTRLADQAVRKALKGDMA